VLVKELQKRRHEVYIVDLPHNHQGKYTRCDVGEWAEVQRVVRGYDMVYHLAAEFGRHNGEDYYQRLWRSNVIGTKNILRAQEEYGFKCVYFSSSEVYGDYEGVMTEDVMENHEIRQLNDYAVSKWTNEVQVMNSAAQHDTQSVRVRLFNTYGEGEYYSPYRSAICQFIYKALHSEPITVYTGHKRTSTYVTDTVRTLANIADNFKAGEVYNIGGTELHTMEQVAEIVAEQVYLQCQNRVARFKLREPEPFTTKNKIVDCSKATRDLDHKCEVSLEDGIRRTVAWMKAVYHV